MLKGIQDIAFKSLRESMYGKRPTQYSLIYRPPADGIPLFLDEWERDLNLAFSPQQKHRLLYFTLKSSICSEVFNKKLKETVRGPKMSIH